MQNFIITDIEIIERILNIIIFIAGGLIFTFFNKYITKKARNEADLEDTGALTRIQEAVKQTFKTEIAKMELKHQHQLNLTTERRNAIFDLSDSLHEMIQTSLTLIYDISYQDDSSYIHRLYTVFSKINLKYKLSRERLNLLFKEDQNFVNIETTLYANVQQVQIVTVKFFKEFHRLEYKFTKEELEGLLVGNEEDLRREKRYWLYNDSVKQIHALNDKIGGDFIRIKSILQDLIESIFNDTQQPNP